LQYSAKQHTNLVTYVTTSIIHLLVKNITYFSPKPRIGENNERWDVYVKETLSLRYNYCAHV